MLKILFRWLWQDNVSLHCRKSQTLFSNHCPLWLITKYSILWKHSSFALRPKFDDIGQITDRWSSTIFLLVLSSQCCYWWLWASIYLLSCRIHKCSKSKLRSRNRFHILRSNVTTKFQPRFHDAINDHVVFNYHFFYFLLFYFTNNLTRHY